MVNMWPGVPAKCLCDKHLNAVLAEYNNLLLPSMRKGKSIKGYVLHGCVDLPYAYGRILNCLEEAKKRGNNWKYQTPDIADAKLHMDYMRLYQEDEFPDIDDIKRRKEMAEMNKRILAFRCSECRERIDEEMMKR